MDTDQNKQRTAEQRARQRVAEVKGFYIHLFVYIAVLVLLFSVNLSTGSDWWVHWVFLGWGIGVLVHALAIFGRPPAFITRWEERKTKEYMNER